jgi:hypothetical protein
MTEAWRGRELHCSYTDIKKWKATKVHQKHTNEERKENVDHNRIMKWFIPGNLCFEGEGLMVAMQH